MICSKILEISGSIRTDSIMRILSGILALLLFVSCQKPDTIPPYYFILFPLLRKGYRDRPTQPVNLQASYQPVFQTINLQWNPSMDPGFNIPVQYYRIYIYTYGPPTEYYRNQDRLSMVISSTLPQYDSPVPFYSLSSSPFSGSVYFVVTGYDLSAESLPSSAVRLSL